MNEKNIELLKESRDNIEEILSNDDKTMLKSKKNLLRAVKELKGIKLILNGIIKGES